MDIVLATGNKHKKQELEQILRDHTILLPADGGVNFACDETGQTFLDNALLKAQALYRQVQRPVLADDSGLCVKALGGAPGIYSARYGSEGGKTLSDRERYEYLLKNLEGQKDREACFVCAMVLILSPYRVYSVQEVLDGSIALTPLGDGGFGYDPVFIDRLSGKRIAEMGEEEKNRISHRGRAGFLINKLLEDLG
jgi:XTP/dITP diphosphohydrolase